MATSRIPASEAITQVSTAEIARNLARLQRAELAVERTYTQPEDSEIAWELAQPEDAEGTYLGIQWVQPEQRALAYERLMIDSLHLAFNLTAVTKAAEAPYRPVDIKRAPPRTHTETRDLGRIIYDQARVEALGRLGIVDIRRTRGSVPLGVLAALHYRRADIRSEVDRTLYERASAIDARTDRILSQVPLREVAITVLAASTPKTRMGHKQVNVSVFSAVESDTKWWQEVAYDLRQIDKASGSW